MKRLVVSHLSTPARHPHQLLRGLLLREPLLRGPLLLSLLQGWPLLRGPLLRSLLLGGLLLRDLLLRSLHETVLYALEQQSSAESDVTEVEEISIC